MGEKKIKIAIVINNMMIGGAQRLIVDQFRYFDRNKFDYSLLILSKFSGQADFMDELPKDLKIYQFDFKNFSSFKEWFKLFKILQKIRPQVVRSSLFMSNTIVRVFKPFLGYQVIITENNTHYNKSKFKIYLDKLLAIWTYKITPDSQTVTDFTIKQEKINQNKFLTIYNGVDIEEIKNYLSLSQENNLKKELGIAQNGKIVLNIARLVRQKNHKLLIESFAKFSKLQPDYNLIIVGDGTLMPDLKKQAKDLGVENKVFFPGASKDLYQYYAISDLFVISSTQEGFCLTAVMALAFGIPVVATKVAGLVEYIKDDYNGLLATYNSDELSLKMSKLASLEIGQREIYKKNCQATAENFDIKKHAKAFEDLFLASLN
ncbi:MAG: glycosyltransferase [Patescibacteria group bacterium]